MRKLILVIAFVFSLALPVSALEISPPQVPDSGSEVMPDDTDSFSDALRDLLRNSVRKILPDLTEASRIAVTVTCGVMILSLLHTFCSSAKKSAETAGAVLLASALLSSTNSLIRLGADTVTELSEYGKLLLPVMTAAMAAQGGTATSAALYTSTAAFDLLLSNLISKLLVPMVYVYLALAVANSAVGEELLKKFRDFIKWLVGWILKTLLTVFTTYISISGVVSGTTDALALKATKMTISSVVPVVGGILSDASEAVLVSAGLLKNAAGIYGILAVLAVFLTPFLRIGIHYAVLKLTAAICSLFGEKHTTGLIEDFSTAMGFLLAMTGSACLLLLISTICFLKGIH